MRRRTKVTGQDTVEVGYWTYRGVGVCVGVESCHWKGVPTQCELSTVSPFPRHQLSVTGEGQGKSQGTRGLGSETVRDKSFTVFQILRTWRSPRISGEGYGTKMIWIFVVESQRRGKVMERCPRTTLWGKQGPDVFIRFPARGKEIWPLHSDWPVHPSAGLESVLHSLHQWLGHPRSLRGWVTYNNRRSCTQSCGSPFFTVPQIYRNSLWG